MKALIAIAILLVGGTAGYLYYQQTEGSSPVDISSSTENATNAKRSSDDKFPNPELNNSPATTMTTAIVNPTTASGVSFSPDKHRIATFEMW